MSAACSRCGELVDAGQEYCLGCGARLPGPGRLDPREAGEGWLLRAGALLAVALVGTLLAVAATSGGRGDSDVLTATGGFATVPTVGTLPSGEAGEAEIAEWPAGAEGWTIALASIPQTEGRRAALGRARAARRRGLSSVGIIDSSSYASLHPGYWVVFAGVYASEAEAASALGQARRAARSATVRRIVP